MKGSLSISEVLKECCCFLLSSEYLSIPGDIFVCSKFEEGTINTQYVDARHTRMLKIATYNSYTAQNVVVL
jgi:hypothetical protein